jgi:hypothetical protein
MTLNMEAICHPETSGSLRITLPYNPGDLTFHSHHTGNPKSNRVETLHSGSHVTTVICVRGSVTNSNGFWIGWLDLLALLSQSLLITISYNSSQPMAVWDSLHSLLHHECLLFRCDWLGSDLRIVSFRCPLVNTPQLNTELNCLLNSLTTRTQNDYPLTSERTLEWVWVWALRYDRRSAGQSVSEQSTHLGLTTNLYYCLTAAGLLIWGALSDERTGVVYKCYWPSPA